MDKEQLTELLNIHGIDGLLDVINDEINYAYITGYNKGYDEAWEHIYV